MLWLGMWNQGRGPEAGVKWCVGWDLLVLEVGEEGGGGAEAREEGEEGGAQGREGGGRVAQVAVGEVEGGQELGAQARRGGEWCVGCRRVGGGKAPQEEGQRLVAGGAVGRLGGARTVRVVRALKVLKVFRVFRVFKVFKVFRVLRAFKDVRGGGGHWGVGFGGAPGRGGLGAQEGEEAAVDVGVEDVVDGARARGEGFEGYVARLDADGRGEVAVADFQGDAAGRRAALAHDAAYDAAERAVDHAHGVGRGQIDFAGGIDREVVGLGGGDAPESLDGVVAERYVAPPALSRRFGGSVNYGVDLGAGAAERAQLGGRSAQKGVVEQQGCLHAARAAALGAVEPAYARGKKLWRSLFRAHGGDGAAERFGGGAPAVGRTQCNQKPWVCGGMVAGYGHGVKKRLRRARQWL